MPNSLPTRDLFKAEMPRIPGVNETITVSGKHAAIDARVLTVSAILALVGLIVVFYGGGFASLHQRLRHLFHSHSSPAAVSQPIEVHAQEMPTGTTAPVVTRGGMSPATLSELPKPWSAKEFTFADPFTHADGPAMVVRLPGLPATNSNAYWAFSLEAPYETCRLEYITDVNQLASRYHYRASHPMVAAPCDGTVYDPLQMGTTPADAWVRGEVVHGMGIRPPLSIEIRVRGQLLIADRME